MVRTTLHRIVDTSAHIQIFHGFKGAVFSSIGSAVNTVISAIAGLIMAIVSGVTMVRFLYEPSILYMHACIYHASRPC